MTPVASATLLWMGTLTYRSWQLDMRPLSHSVTPRKLIWEGQPALYLLPIPPAES